MTIKEAIMTLNANAVIACERAGFSSATVKMIEDALDTIEDALHAQEPRVMTLEYFDNSLDKDSKGCLVAWVEYRRDEEWAEYWEGTCDEWSVIRRDDFYSGESYRFWTSRPTDAQREAVPWNAQN